MRKMFLIIGLVVAAVSISGMALALDPGINTSTGAPTPQYSSSSGGGTALWEFNPGINTATGMPNSPAATKSLGKSTNGIEQFNPGINTSTGVPNSPVAGQSKSGSNMVVRKPIAPK